MTKNTYFLVSLGCSKNTVDSDSIAFMLNQAGYFPVTKPAQAEILIVNTCGFIQPARQESLETLAELAKGKKETQLLVAAGCMPETHRKDIIESIPGVDGIIGTRRWMDMVTFIQKIRTKKDSTPFLYDPHPSKFSSVDPSIPRYTIQGASAYLKIADGCRRTCTFCSIPMIKGTLQSREVEVILNEAVNLQEKGVLEINLIAQDTTDYGHDLGIEDGLSHLLAKMIPLVPDVPWIRLLYAYPGFVTDRLIGLMAEQPQILPYLDLPLQHAHPDILKKMGRPANIDWVYKTIEKIRNIIPKICLRSTFIVGFPGETENEFRTLLEFIKTIQFDRVGAFEYSFEKGTPAETYGDPIPQEIKQARLEELMKIQETISLMKNQSLVGNTLPVLVEGRDKDISVGRTYRDAPEVDGLVVIYGKVPVGKIVPVVISEAMVHDLAGFPAKSITGQRQSL